MGPRALLRLAPLVVAGALMARPAAAQIVVDSTVETIGGQVIMQSDIPVARTLKLVPLGDGSDDAILTALENRFLMLAEATRAPIGEPTAADVAAHRREWEQSLGGDPTVLMKQVGMSERGLTAWLRDDVRIRQYETQLFAHRPDPEAEIANWIKELRRRAGLK